MKDKKDRIIYSEIRKKFRELNIPEEHIDHIRECKSCYNFVFKHLNKG